jgi:hypothetical protein
VGLARDLILGNDADRRIARPLVSKCSIGGNFRAHAMEGVSVQVWNRSWSLSWARELTKLGHQVQLMPAKDVKAYVKRNKSGCSRRRGGSARPYDVRPCVLCRSNRPNSRAG